jgi:UDP-glucose 4-epimerase
MKVSITGSSGYIGRALNKYLLNFDFKVLPYSRKIVKGLKLIDDYKNISNSDVIIHLGEESNRSKVNKIGKHYIYESHKTLKYLLDKKFRSFIYFSSALVYGDQYINPIEESFATFAMDTYTESKLKNERIVIEAGGIVIRLSNVIGSNISKQNIFSEIINQLKVSNTVCINDEFPVRDYVDLEIVCNSILNVINSNVLSGVFNLGSNKGYSVKELAIIISEKFKKSVLIESKNKIYHYSNIVLNSNKFKKTFNITKCKPIEQSISEIIEEIN